MFDDRRMVKQMMYTNNTIMFIISVEVAFQLMASSCHMRILVM